MVDFALLALGKPCYQKVILSLFQAYRKRHLSGEILSCTHSIYIPVHAYVQTKCDWIILLSVLMGVVV
jgi:hypothetical protein